MSDHRLFIIIIIDYIIRTAEDLKIINRDLQDSTFSKQTRKSFNKYSGD